MRYSELHGQLSGGIGPLAEWKFWDREQKRSLLAALVPDIRVADYRIESLGLDPGIFSNEDTRTGMDSSPQPA